MMSAAFSHKPSNLLLAMGGTEERLQLVLGEPFEDGYRLLASREWTVPGQSLRFLSPGLKEVLDSFNVTMANVDKIACVRGPGSFTGLRLVLAAAEGLAAGSDVQMAGIDYLPLLASGPAQICNGILHVLTYARRGLVYLQSFNVPSLREAYPLTSLTLAEAAEKLEAMSDTASLMGSGLRKNHVFFTELAEKNPGYILLPALWDNPSPDLLLEAAVKADFSDDSIDPVYVRATDAEDNLPHFAKKRGMDPVEAVRRLNELQNN